MTQMFSRVKLLVPALILTAFNSNPNVLVRSVKLLDMSHSVVDDMYEGCREKAMEAVIQSGLLSQELDNSEKFQKAWNANTQCSVLIPGGIKEHTAALSAFYHGDKQFIKDVNAQVETMGENLTDFQFKSFHFLLMDAFMLLKPKKCKTGFAIVDDLKIPKVGSAVRLAGFTMVDSDEELLGDLDDSVFLNINSCYYVNLEESICKKNVGQMLLSPSEVFIVEKVDKIANEDATYDEVVLRHSSLSSTHNCLVFSRAKAVTSAHMLVPLIVVYSFFSATF